MADFDFSDINLEFLQLTPPRKPQGGQRICTPEWDIGSRQICDVKKVKSKKILDWGSRIANTDQLLKDIKTLTKENLELRTQLKDVQNSAFDLRKMYDSEKNEHDLKSKQLAVLHEKLDQVDGDLTVKNLKCEQLEAELAIIKQRPVEYNTLAVKYLRVVNKMDVEEYKRYFNDRRMNENLRQYCVNYKLSIPLPTSPKMPKYKELQRENAATQCDLMNEPTVVQPEMKNQSTQCHVDKRSQACQHISTMTTRGTTTACFIKYRTIGTCFPETQSASVVDDILREFAPWHNITPISPLVDHPFNNDKCEPVKKQSFKSIGTCTWLCNIRRTIDFIPRKKQQHSNFPTCDKVTTQSIKQEVTTPSPSPTPNVLTNSNGNPNTNPIGRAQPTEAASSSEAHAATNRLFTALHSSFPLRQLSDRSFDSLWHIFGRMLMGLLQSSNAGIASNPTHNTSQEAVNQHQFYRWLQELYESSATASEANVHQHIDGRSTDNATNRPVHLDNLEPPEIVAENTETNNVRHTVATSPLQFHEISAFETPPHLNVIRPQPQRRFANEESSGNREAYPHDDGIQSSICSAEISRVQNVPPLINNEDYISRETLSSEKPKKKNRLAKVPDRIKKLVPAIKISKSGRKSLKRLSKFQKQKGKTKKLCKKEKHGVFQILKEETAVDFIKNIFVSSKKMDDCDMEGKETTKLENKCNVEIVKVENLRNFILKSSTENKEELTPSESHNSKDSVANDVLESLKFKKPKNLHKNTTSSKHNETISANNILPRKKELYTSLFGDSEMGLEDIADNGEYFNGTCSMLKEHRPVPILSESNELNYEHNNANKNKWSDDANSSLSLNELTNEFPTPLLKSINKPLNREPAPILDKETHEELEALIDRQINNPFVPENGVTLPTPDLVPSDFKTYLEMFTNANNHNTDEKALENTKFSKESIESGVSVIMQSGYNKFNARDLDYIQCHTQNSTCQCDDNHPQQTESYKELNFIEFEQKVGKNIVEKTQTAADIFKLDGKKSLHKIASDTATRAEKTNGIHLKCNNFRSDISEAYKLKSSPEKEKTLANVPDSCSFLSSTSINDECISLASKKILDDCIDERSPAKVSFLETTPSLHNLSSTTNFISEAGSSNSHLISASHVSKVSLNPIFLKTNFEENSSGDEEMTVLTMSTDDSCIKQERRCLVETPSDELIIDMAMNNAGELEKNYDFQHQASMNSNSFELDSAISQQKHIRNTDSNLDIQKSKNHDSAVQKLTDDLNTSKEISLLLNSTFYKDILTDSVLSPLVDNVFNDDNFMIVPPKPSEEKAEKRGHKRKSECQPEELPACKRLQGLKTCKNNLSIMAIEIGKYTTVTKVNNSKSEIRAKAFNKEEENYTSLETNKKEFNDDVPAVSLGFFREIDGNANKTRSLNFTEACKGIENIDARLNNDKSVQKMNPPNSKPINTEFSNISNNNCDSLSLSSGHDQSLPTLRASGDTEINLEQSECINFRSKPLNTDTSSHNNIANFSDYDSPLSPPSHDNTIDTQLNATTLDIPVDVSPQYSLAFQANSLLERLMGHYSVSEFRRIRTNYSQSASSYTQTEQVFATQYENILKDYCCENSQGEFERMALEVVSRLQRCSIKNSILCKTIINTVKNAEASTAKENELPSIIYEMPPRHFSPCLQQLFYLLKVINTVKPTFCKQLLTKIDATLFNVQNSEKLTLSGSVHLIQLYLMTCKFVESNFEQHPARMLIAKCLYFHAIKAISMIQEILMWCPKAIPPREDRTYERSDALINVIQHLLMTTKYDMDNGEVRGKQLLSKLRFEYHYTSYKPSLDETICLLIEKIKMSEFCNLSLSLSLLCKRMQPKRTAKLLESSLLPLANKYFSEALRNTECDERIANILDIISKVVKPLPPETNVEVYLNLFSRFLTNFNRTIIQESALCAIIRMQRFGYVNCFQRLIGFQPTFEFSLPTQAMLRTFIHRKPLSLLHTLLNQSRGN